MSIKDTIKSLEEADEKLVKAIGFEKSAVANQKEAARLRQESQSNLDQIFTERQAINSINSFKDSEYKRKEEELKNREVKLSAGQAALLRDTTASNTEWNTKNAALDSRYIAADKAEGLNKQQKEALDAVAENYKLITAFIKKHS
jgi:hypothetical protein